MPKLPKKPKIGKSSSSKPKKDDKKKKKKSSSSEKKSSNKKSSKQKKKIIEESFEDSSDEESSEDEEEYDEESSSEEEEEESSDDDSSSDDKPRRGGRGGRNQNQRNSQNNNNNNSSTFQHADDYDPENALDAIIDMVVDYPDPEEGWDVVREWLQSHDFNETKAAIEYKGEFDTTALHVACRNRPPKDVIDVMIMAAPDMIFWADSFGWLPLHYACANGAEIDVVGALLEAYPDSKLTTDKRGRTPLHFALGNVEQPPTAMLVQLLAGKEMKSSSVRWPDENNMLPLHYACAYGASVEVLRVIIDAWDESLSKVDNKGRTPLHFAMGNAHRDNSPEVVKLLLDLHPAGVNVMDVEKNLPLNLLSSKAESVEQNQIKTRDCVKKCLNLYLKAKPSTCIEFLTAIQKMPEW